MISVITRTQDRNLFLPRVYQSLKTQNFRPIEWIIVNDAGESVSGLIEEFQKDTDGGFIIKYIEKQTSTTMEAATNVGINASSGEYIHILDDDDTIAQGFYTDAIEQLEAINLDKIGGIISYSAYVYEEVTQEGQVRHIRTEDFPLKPSYITITAMLRQNQFPIHAFIYKKSILEKVGLYNEELPVLGDWDFNLRFLQYYDIAVLPKQYAFYHKRENGQYLNSIHSQINMFSIYEGMIKNNIIRKYYDKSLPSLLGEGENTRLILDVYQTDLARKNREVVDAQAKIAQLETTVHAKNLEAATLKEDKDKLLTSIDKLLRDKDTHIANIEHALQEKENHVNNIEKDLKLEELEDSILDKNRHNESSEQTFRDKEAKLNAYIEIFKKLTLEAFEPIEKDTRKLSSYFIPILNISKLKRLRKDIFRLKYNLAKLNTINTEVLGALDLKNYDLDEVPAEDIKKRLEHFILFGYSEVQNGQRSLYKELPKISEQTYIDIFEDIQSALEHHHLDSAYRHFLLHGAQEILSGVRSLPSIPQAYTYVPPEFDEEVQESLESFAYHPLISIVMPVYNVDPKWLQLAIDSLKAQWYTDWELCIADDKSTNEETVAFLYSLDDEKIKVTFLDENVNISGSSNAALKLAQGEYIALMDNDDELTPDALYAVVKAINEFNAEFIYSDEDKLELDGSYTDPHFKPDFSPEMFLSQNYISHLGVIKKSLIDEVCGWEIGLEGAQDYDLYLKVLEHTDKVVHIPKVLYHWRKIPGSTAAEFSDKSYAQDAGRKALQHAMERRNVAAEVDNGLFPGTYRVRYMIQNDPLVSIIIPFKDKPELLDMCINSILDNSTYQNYEIIGMSNNSHEAETFEMMKQLSEKDIRVKFYEYNHPFNYSAINNHAVEHYARGEHLILLNNDIEIISPDWIESMLEFSQRKDIGAVGAKLYYPNDTLQHAGVIIGIGGVAGHSHKHFSKEEHGYFSRPHLIQNLSAITAACLMVKKSIYKEVKGLNEEDLKIAFNDVDFCLRIIESGYLNIYTPYCEAYHHESISRGMEDNPEKIVRFNKEVDYMKKRHKDILIQGDPYYNTNLTLEDESFGLK